MRRIVRPRVVIMVKEPRAGQVKTRLGRDIGMTASAWWFRHQTRRLIGSLARDKRWQLRLSVSPAPQALHSRVWPLRIPRDAQIRGDLGQRMCHILEETPSGPVVIIGGDIPGITPEIINDAFKVLRNKEFVFGPAEDGGYWLVGMRRGARPMPSKIFESVRWSCEHTLADTLATLEDAPVGFVTQLRDVDTVADLP